MKISPRRQFWLLMLLFVIGGLVIGALLVALQMPVLEWSLYAWLFGCSWLLFRIKCPNCGVTIAYQGELGGIPIYAGYAHKKCRNCDFDLENK